MVTNTDNMPKHITSTGDYESREIDFDSDSDLYPGWDPALYDQWGNIRCPLDTTTDYFAYLENPPTPKEEDLLSDEEAEDLAYEGCHNWLRQAVDALKSGGVETINGMDPEVWFNRTIG